MTGPKPIVERLRAPAYWFSGSDEGHEGENTAPYEAADHITSLEADNARTREALVYVRKSLGDPLPIGRRHVARVVDAALSPRGES